MVTMFRLRSLITELKKSTYAKKQTNMRTSYKINAKIACVIVCIILASRARNFIVYQNIVL